jgi:hypothetical protein
MRPSDPSPHDDESRDALRSAEKVDWVHAGLFILACIVAYFVVPLFLTWFTSPMDVQR